MFDIPVKSMTLSPTGMFLATAHVGDLGVYLWSNMTMFGSAVLTPLPADYEPGLIELPSTDDRTRGFLFFFVYCSVLRCSHSRVLYIVHRLPSTFPFRQSPFIFNVLLFEKVNAHQTTTS